MKQNKRPHVVKQNDLVILMTQPNTSAVFYTFKQIWVHNIYPSFQCEKTNIVKISLYGTKGGLVKTVLAHAIGLVFKVEEIINPQ